MLRPRSCKPFWTRRIARRPFPHRACQGARSQSIIHSLARKSKRTNSVVGSRSIPPRRTIRQSRGRLAVALWALPVPRLPVETHISRWHCGDRGVPASRPAGLVSPRRKRLLASSRYIISWILRTLKKPGVTPLPGPTGTAMTPLLSFGTAGKLPQNPMRLWPCGLFQDLPTSLAFLFKDHHVTLIRVSDIKPQGVRCRFSNNVDPRS